MTATKPYGRAALYIGGFLGPFDALQAAGQTSAPLVGGIATEASWRWALVVIAVVAAALAVVGVPMAPGRAPTDARKPRLREVLRWRVIRIGFVAMLAWGALGGMSFLVAFRVEDEFGLGPTGRGLVLTCFGLTGIVAARPAGSAIDRGGARRCSRRCSCPVGPRAEGFAGPGSRLRQSPAPVASTTKGIRCSSTLRIFSRRLPPRCPTGSR